MYVQKLFDNFWFTTNLYFKKRIHKKQKVLNIVTALWSERLISFVLRMKILSLFLQSVGSCLVEKKL